MGLMDKVQDKFVETLVNRIIDNKKIIITASFEDKSGVTSDNILDNIINNKKVIASIEFEEKK